MKNVNHRNYFLKSDIVDVKEEEIVEKTEEVIESNIEIESPYTEEFLYNLNKTEQLELLEELGLNKKEIKKLKYEEDRVQTILNLINEVE